MLILIKLQNKIASIYFFPSQIIGGILCLAIVVYKYGITYIRENVLSYEDSILLFDKTINKDMFELFTEIFSAFLYLYIFRNSEYQYNIQILMIMKLSYYLFYKIQFNDFGFKFLSISFFTIDYKEVNHIVFFVVLAGKFPMSNYYVDGIQIVILNKLIVIGKHTKIQGIEDNDGDWIADIMKNEFCECENCVEQRKSNKDSNIK